MIKLLFQIGIICSINLLYSQSYRATYEVKFKEGFSKEKMKKGLEKELDGKESQLYKRFIADA